ncbi:MAG: cytochrome c biogenesis protein CcdA [Dethiobacter sp.]|jgi:cytochrome c-type biogenesis protein|nr:cytochrome c biogenesis protein CcdA [Dethiobacter sp.]
MEQGNLTVLIAFFAGVVSFFSPCLLPLLPVYLGFLTGSMLDEDGRPVKRRALVNSVNFVAGFTLVFILFGVIASWFAGFFAANRLLLQRVSGAVIIIFGLHLAGLFVPLLQRERRVRFVPHAVSPGSAMLMGVAFAAGWTPCIGPVLGAILAVTAAAGGGVSLLVAFSLGMALPFLLAALLVEHVAGFVDRFSVYMPHLQRIMGLVMVLLGVAVFFGLLSRLAVF